MTRIQKLEGNVLAIGLAVSMGFAALVACAPAEPTLPTVDQCVESVTRVYAEWTDVTPDDVVLITQRCAEEFG